MIIFVNSYRYLVLTHNDQFSTVEIDEILGKKTRLVFKIDGIKINLTFNATISTQTSL